MSKLIIQDLKRTIFGNSAFSYVLRFMKPTTKKEH